MLSERDGCLSEPIITHANYLEKLFLLTEWEQHSHMEALEEYVHNMHGACSYSINKVQLYILLIYYATSEYVCIYNILYIILFLPCHCFALALDTMGRMSFWL